MSVTKEDIPNFMLRGNEYEKPNCEVGALCFFLQIKDIEKANPTESSINGEHNVGATSFT